MASNADERGADADPTSDHMRGRASRARVRQTHGGFPNANLPTSQSRPLCPPSYGGERMLELITRKMCWNFEGRNVYRAGRLRAVHKRASAGDRNGRWMDRSERFCALTLR